MEINTVNPLMMNTEDIISLISELREELDRRGE